LGFQDTYKTPVLRKGCAAGIPQKTRTFLEVLFKLKNKSAPSTRSAFLTSLVYITCWAEVFVLPMIAVVVPIMVVIVPVAVSVPPVAFYVPPFV
jgi:hypothetical protein